MSSHTGELPTFTWHTGAQPQPARLISALVAAVVLVAALAWTTRARHREDVAAAAAGPAVAAAGIFASTGRRASHGDRYHAEVVAATPFAVGVRQTWTVRLTHPGHRRVSDARLTVRTSAPETGEVSTISPSVRYVGGGRYRLDGVYFPHAGWWNVALVIDAARGIDSVAFNIVMPAQPGRDSEQLLRAARVEAAGR